MYCRECGKKLEESVEVCQACGVPTPLYYKNKISNDYKSMENLLPVNRPLTAIASGYVGLFALAIPGLGIVSIILGILGLKAISVKPEMIGKVRCWLGIIFGVISILLLVFLLIAGVF